MISKKKRRKKFREKRIGFFFLIGSKIRGKLNKNQVIQYRKKLYTKITKNTCLLVINLVFRCCSDLPEFQCSFQDMFPFLQEKRKTPFSFCSPMFLLRLPTWNNGNCLFNSLQLDSQNVSRKYFTFGDWSNLYLK